MIAVTGATGFLGAHVVCTLLQTGATVKAFKRKNSNLDEFNYIYPIFFKDNIALQRLTWIEADVLDVQSIAEALDDATEVYHCAAMVSFFKKDTPKMMQVNVEGTANMVNISLQLGIKKFAYISSIAALGRAKDGAHINENTRWVDAKTNSNYAVSKHKAEMEVWRAAEEGLNVVIVNPGVILGSGNWRKGSCALFGMVKRGMPFYTNGVNGYVDVIDVANVTIALMKGNVFNQRFVLVSQNADMHWFLNQTSAHLNKKPPFIKVNKWIAEAAWVLAFVANLFKKHKSGLTKETSRASLKKYYYSNQKITTQLNYNFIPLEQTIANACHQLINHPYT